MSLDKKDVEANAHRTNVLREVKSHIANSQALRKLTPAQRMALVLRDNTNNRFNAPIPTRTPAGTSAMARAKASI